MNGILYQGPFENTFIPHIFKEIYLDRVYQNYMKYMLRGKVVDIGGNIGLFSLFAANLAKSIDIYEPSSMHVETIEANLEFNNAKEKVTVYKQAVSIQVGELELHHNQNTTMFSLNALVDDKMIPTEKVPVVTMKEVLANAGGHINFLKLDPEGEEFKIIASSEFEEASKEIDALVVELHSWAGVPYQNMIQMLQDYGYTVEKLETDAFVLGAHK